MQIRSKIIIYYKPVIHKKKRIYSYSFLKYIRKEE
nr:MAG TPA: hypothetical protein [Caudoviricetes sp.]